MDHGWDPARIVEVLHQEPARRHQVGQQGEVVADPVEVVELKRDAKAPRNREQVNDEIRGAANGCVDADRVLERIPGQNLRHADVIVDHLNDAPSAQLREGGTP